MEKDYISCCTLGCLRNWASVGWPFGPLGFRIYCLSTPQSSPGAGGCLSHVLLRCPAAAGQPRAHGCPRACGHWFTSLLGLDMNLFHKSPLAPTAAGCLHASAQQPLPQAGFRPAGSKQR